MKLLEYQAKWILADRGVPVPSGKLVESLDDLDGLMYPVVLKAQMPVGGRGKAGAVRVAGSRDEADKIAFELIGSTVKGYGVKTLLAEETLDVLQELYICCLNDKEKNRPTFIACRDGGVDIEQLAQESPEKMIHQSVDPLKGLMEFDVRTLASWLDLAGKMSFFAVVRGIWDTLRGWDATLVEINPLAITSDGLVALDAKVVFDQNAAYRHQTLFSEWKAGQEGRVVTSKSFPETLAEKYGISYVLLDGDIGIIADGAGTGMLTLDMVKDMGGRPANFCEMGGKAAAEAACQAMEIVLANPNVKSLLISLIGGLTRMDHVAEGIDTYLGNHDCHIPILVRMCGTNAEKGVRILSVHGIDARPDLSETVRMAIGFGGK